MIDSVGLRRKIETLGLAVTEEQLSQLIRYASLLQKWNKVYNLTRITKEDDIVNLHLIDSLTLVKAVRDLHLPLKRVLDVGSGGGLPAIPFAVLEPEADITMVDAVKKKALFLTQVCVELGLKNARALHARIEEVREEPFDAVTSRAFASLSDMCALTSHLLAPDGLWLAMKGKEPKEEMGALNPEIGIDRILRLEVPGVSVERNLIVLRKR